MAKSGIFAKTFARVAILATALLSAGASAHAQSANDKSQVVRCVHYMLLGMKYEGLEFKGQGYNCKPVTVKIVGDKLEVSGQLSHQLTLRPDDQVDFKYVFKADGLVESSNVKLRNGGLLQPLRWLGKPWEWLHAGDRNANPFESAWDAYGEFTSPKWQDDATLILSALQGVISKGLAVRGAGSISYFMDRHGGDLRHQTLVPGQRLAGVSVEDKFPDSYIRACAALCRADTACRSWTYRPKGKICYAKGPGAAAPAFNIGAITGAR